MKKEDRKKLDQTHICHICGKEVGPDEDQEYVRTKRGSDLYMHKQCVRRTYGRNYECK